MEISILIPSPPVDCNFDSTLNSPYVTAPSTPQRSGNYFYTAPTSPARSSFFFNQFEGEDTSPSNNPFNCEEKPGVPKRSIDTDTEFAFDLQLDRASVSADELFDEGKIKLLEPSPWFQYSDSPKHPKRMFTEVFLEKKDIDSFSEAFQQTLGVHDGTESETDDRGGLARVKYFDSLKSQKSMFTEASWKKKEIDPFSEAFQQTLGVYDGTESETYERGGLARVKYFDSPKSLKSMFSEGSWKKKEVDSFSEAIQQTGAVQKNGRRRELTQSSPNSRNKHKSSRSLSPLRISDMLLEPENETNLQRSKQSSGSSVSTWYSKWKLKDLLLFRSKSEGSARNEKDPLWKYSLLKKNESEDVKKSSFRSTESGKGRISAHELHYTVNRAVADEMKKKTYLPYKRGLLGCLRFNSPPILVNEFSRRFGTTG